MRKLRGAALAFAAVSAALLLALSAPVSSAAPAKVLYEQDAHIQVTFTGGSVSTEGGKTVVRVDGEFTVTASSQRYDMARAGITFFKLDPQGNPIRTSNVSPAFNKSVSGNTATFTFFNLSEDVEMEFFDLELLGQGNGGGTPVEAPGGTTPDAPGTAPDVPGGVAAAAPLDIDPVTVMIAAAAAA
ncbi:MAG: hypothetical protein FWH47_03020, partial [Methanomassiliicoccaceae archaeon]|nr:hypothetical protein [Methanomassiliicoccaceae archaeon]